MLETKRLIDTGESVIAIVLEAMRPGPDVRLRKVMAAFVRQKPRPPLTSKGLGIPSSTNWSGLAL